MGVSSRWSGQLAVIGRPICKSGKGQREKQGQLAERLCCCKALFFKCLFVRVSIKVCLPLHVSCILARVHCGNLVRPDPLYQRGRLLGPLTQIATSKTANFELRHCQSLQTTCWNKAETVWFLPSENKMNSRFTGFTRYAKGFLFFF